MMRACPFWQPIMSGVLPNLSRPSGGTPRLSSSFACLYFPCRQKLKSSEKSCTDTLRFSAFFSSDFLLLSLRSRAAWAMASPTDVGSAPAPGGGGSPSPGEDARELAREEPREGPARPSGASAAAEYSCWGSPAGSSAPPPREEALAPSTRALETAPRRAFAFRRCSSEGPPSGARAPAGASAVGTGAPAPAPASAGVDRRLPASWLCTLRAFFSARAASMPRLRPARFSGAAALDSAAAWEAGRFSRSSSIRSFANLACS